MKRENKYVVIGGQYYPNYYGSYPTLIGAKRVASRNEEYWDNWQGWHRPSIYRIEDTHEVITEAGDFMVYKAGVKIRVPNPDAESIA